MCTVSILLFAFDKGIMLRTKILHCTAVPNNRLQHYNPPSQRNWKALHYSKMFFPTLFQEFSPTHPGEAREKETPWLSLVTCLQHKIYSEGGVLCLSILCLVHKMIARVHKSKMVHWYEFFLKRHIQPSVIS